VVSVGPYPVEVSFYPEHLIIPLITLLIFVIILFVIARIRKNQLTRPTDQIAAQVEKRKEVIEKRGTSEYKNKPLKQAEAEVESGRLFLSEFKAGDTISLITLIGTIVAALVVPFSQLPVLDYEVKKVSAGNQDTQIFEIAVRNHGAIAAENVIISFKADNTEFEGFSSLPYLAKRLIYNTATQGNDIGKAAVEIKELPPRSYTVVSATLSPINIGKNNAELITYLRSEETVAYHQTSNLMAFYGILAFFYVFFALGFATGLIYPLREPGNTIHYRRIVIIGISILSAIIATNLLFFLPHLDLDNILYLTYYWVGLLLIPVTILIICIIYHLFQRPLPTTDYRDGAVITGLVLSLIVSVGLAIYLPQIDANRPLYIAAATLSPLVIPIAITIVFMVYRRHSKAVLLACGTVALVILMLFILGLLK
jgi:hypothetical protein